MAALIAGLNSPPIRRLKRTWELLNTRVTATLDDVELTLDSGRNFTGYRALLATVNPPCIPFLGGLKLKGTHRCVLTPLNLT